MYVYTYVCIYIYIYIHTHVYAYIYISHIPYNSIVYILRIYGFGKRDTIHHHLLEVTSKAEAVPELGWWWCIDSLFRGFDSIRILFVRIRIYQAKGDSPGNVT